MRWNIISHKLHRREFASTTAHYYWHYQKSQTGLRKSKTLMFKLQSISCSVRNLFSFNFKPHKSVIYVVDMKISFSYCRNTCLIHQIVVILYTFVKNFFSWCMHCLFYLIYPSNCKLSVYSIEFILFIYTYVFVIKYFIKISHIKFKLFTDL